MSGELKGLRGRARARVQGILKKPKEKKNGLNGVLVSLGIDEEWTLVVENDRGTLEELCRILDSEGCKIDVSDTALDAISLLSRRTYVLVLMSGFLPDMSVLQFVRVVNSLAPDSVKIVILDEADVDVGDEALTVGADDVIFKPVVPVELLSLIEERLRKQRSDSEEVLFTLGERCKVVACIPAYNEERRIGPVVLKTLEFVDQVIVCDDGSEDLTGQIAAIMGANVITHERNRGYGAAIRSLQEEALRLGADIAVTLDGDGQHDPADIPQIVDAMELGDSDIVIGSRFVEGGYSEAPGWRERGIGVITGMVSNHEVSLTDAQSGMRAYNRSALESLVLTEDGMGVSTEILLKAIENGLRVSEVPVSVGYDEDSSTRNPVTHGLDVVLTTLKHMSINKPLLFYGLPGVVSLIISLFFWMWNFEVFTQTRGIITNVAIVAIGTTIVGLMLLTTSIILWVVVTLIREGMNK